MILEAFSNHLKQTDGQKPLQELTFWLVKNYCAKTENKISTILRKELHFAKNPYGNFLILGKSPSGRRLMKSLYEFAQAYENQETARFLHGVKPDDFLK